MKTASCMPCAVLFRTRSLPNGVEQGTDSTGREDSQTPLSLALAVHVSARFQFCLGLELLRHGPDHAQDDAQDNAQDWGHAKGLRAGQG